jgi:hypothetical protein
MKRFKKPLVYFVFAVFVFGVVRISWNLIKINKVECFAGSQSCPKDILLELQKITPNGLLEKKQNIKRYLNDNK